DLGRPPDVKLPLGLARACRGAGEAYRSRTAGLVGGSRPDRNLADREIAIPRPSGAVPGEGGMRQRLQADRPDPGQLGHALDGVLVPERVGAGGEDGPIPERGERRTT